jgi:nucleotide-binding universal stress UspA family protein
MSREEAKAADQTFSDRNIQKNESPSLLRPIKKPCRHREQQEVSMYKSILVPLDGSKLAENILPEVEELALLLKAKLNLICVSKATVFPGADPTDAQVRVVNEAHNYLENLKKQLPAARIDIEIYTPYGNPAVKILEVSRRHDIDLIAMSTHGRSGIGRWLLGSVAEKVVRHSEIPVLLLRSHKMD